MLETVDLQWNFGGVTAVGQGLAVVDGTLIPVLGNGLVLKRGSITANGTLGAVDISSNVGLTIDGQTAFNVQTCNSGNSYVGVGAGASTTTGTLNTFVGNNAGQSNTTGGENTFVGNIAGQFVTTGHFLTFIGEHAGGYETTAISITYVGNDCGRNTVSLVGGTTAMGKSAMQAGAPANDTAIGNSAMFANSSLITLGGSLTAGDTISLLFTGDWPGSPVTIDTVVPDSSSLSALASTVARSIQAEPRFRSLTSGMMAESRGSVIRLLFNGTKSTGAAITVTPTVIGAGTETVTIGNGYAGYDNVALGWQAMYGGYSLTTASGNVALGANTLFNLSSGGNNFAGGVQAGYNLTTGSHNVLAGPRAGFGLTTGTFNVSLGRFALASAVMAGNQVAIGAGAQQYSTNPNSETHNANVAVGPSSQLGVEGRTTGYGNTSVGGQTLLKLTTGNQNAVYGINAGTAVSSGSENLILGPNVASTTLRSGSGNIYVGASGAIDAATAKESNTFRLGNHATNLVRATGIDTASPAFFLDWIPSSPSYADDRAAAADGIAVGQIYRNGSALHCRIS